MAMLQWRGVSMRFGAATALDRVDLSLERGEVLALLGPSGCGKTTLLRVTAGLETPSGGAVLLDGRDLAGVPPHRRGFGLVFQDYCLFPHLDVAGNVAYGLRMARWPRARVRDRVKQMLALVRLEGFERRSVLSLSGGEQQRVALARGLAPEPRMLMLDEPLGALDATLRAGLIAEVPRILKEAGATALYVTHEQDEALAVADRVAVMRRGTLLQCGTATDLVDHPSDAFVAGFLDLGALVPVRGRRGELVQTPLGEFTVPRARPEGGGGATGGEEPAGSMLLVRHDAVRPCAADDRACSGGGAAARGAQARVVTVQPGAAGTRLRLLLLADGAAGDGPGWEIWCRWDGSRAGEAPRPGALLTVSLDEAKMLEVAPAM